MQKKLIAFAVAGALASPMVFAQSSVTIYGIADGGIEWANNGANHATRVQSGQQSGSRLGFKGTEDIGNGLSALFVLEMGIAMDNGTYSTHATNGGNSSTDVIPFARQAFVGLKSVNAGQVTLGRQVTPFYIIKTQADPFALGLNGTINNLAGVVPGNFDRWNNQVAYMSPKWSGFSVGAAYSTGVENVGTAAANASTAPDAGKSFGLLTQYSDGPVYVGLAYHHTRASAATTTPTGGPSVAGATDVATAKGWYLGTSYNFGVAKLFVNYLTGKQTQDGVSGNLADGNLINVGVKVPFGVHAVTLGYAKAKNKVSPDADARQLAIGYEYAFSKRTNLYAAYAKIDNGSNSSRALGNGIAQGLTVSAGGDPTSLMVGMRHQF